MKREVKPMGRLAAGEFFPPVSDVIHEDEFPKVVQGGIVRPALVGLGELLDEVDQIGIAGHHEGADRDFFAPALDRFIERLVDNSRIETERILVEPAGVVKNCGWFAVGDHEHLLVDIAASAEQTARQLKARPGVRVVWPDSEERQLMETDDFGFVAEHDQ